MRHDQTVEKVIRKLWDAQWSNSSKYVIIMVADVIAGMTYAKIYSVTRRIRNQQVEHYEN